MMQEVTDPNILAQLNSSAAASNSQQATQAAGGLKEVTDPNILQQLNSNSSPQDQSNQGSSLSSISDAITGGMASGAADTFQGAADLPGFIMQHLHIISPETAQKIYADNKNASDMFRPNTPNSILPGYINSASQEHPNIATIAKYGTDIAALTAGTNTVSTIGKAAEAAGAAAEVPGAATAAGVASRMIGQGLLGASASDADRKDANFVLNAAFSPAFDMGGYLLSKLGTKAALAKDIASTLQQSETSLQGLTTDQAAAQSATDMYDATQAVQNKWFNVVKSTPFDETDQAATYQLASKIDNFVDATKNQLTGQQASVLTDVSDTLQSAGSHSDTLDALQSLNQKFSQFSGINASDSLHSFYVDATSQLRNIITDAADREGLGGAMQRANLIYQRLIKSYQDNGIDDIAQTIHQYGVTSDEAKIATNNFLDKYINAKGNGKIVELYNMLGNAGSNIIQNHIVQKIFGSIQDNPGEFNYSKAAQMLGTYIKKTDGVLDPRAVQAMQGVQKLLDSAGSALNNTPVLGHYVGHRLGDEVGRSLPLMGGAAGGYYGYQQGGLEGGVIGGAAGMILGPIVINKISDLMNTPAGQTFLASLAKPSIKMQNAGAVVKALSIIGIHNLTSDNNQDTNNAH